MKKWGLVVTLFYSVLVFALLVPITLAVFSIALPSGSDFHDAYTSWIPWTCAGLVMLGEMLLFWLSVDTTPQRLKPRTHILASAVSTGLLVAILTVAIVLALGLAVRGDKLFPEQSPRLAPTLAAFLIPWLLWAILFYRLWRNCSDPVTRAVAWLLRGSVLELLIAVPAHVIVRRRNDCCAPYVTGWAIASGIAIMLISFGPSVLLLYKKRMERYATRPAEGK